MAQHEEIVVWLDRRWKEAIEHHLKDETLQEHLENVLDELCNQLPEHEYKRISREIWEEDRMAREEAEAARTYSAYRVVEGGEEHYFRMTPGEELLDAAQTLRNTSRIPTTAPANSSLCIRKRSLSRRRSISA